MATVETLLSNNDMRLSTINKKRLVLGIFRFNQVILKTDTLMVWAQSEFRIFEEIDFVELKKCNQRTCISSNVIEPQ